MRKTGSRYAKNAMGKRRGQDYEYYTLAAVTTCMKSHAALDVIVKLCYTKFTLEVNEVVA
jgi:hypothetical protein